MAAAMKRMGIDVRDVPNVEEVIVRAGEKEYRFRKAQVSVMKAQGQETWTIVGKPEITQRGATEAEARPDSSKSRPPTTPAGMRDDEESNAQEPSDDEGEGPIGHGPTGTYTPTAEDIRTVREAANCTDADARKALVDTNGDLAEAILKLS